MERPTRSTQPKKCDGYLPERAPHPKNQKKPASEAQDEITVAPPAPSSADDEVAEVMTEPQQAPPAAAPAAAKEAPAKEPKKKPRPFLQASQTPTSDLKDQKGMNRVTNGVDYKDDTGKTIGRVSVGSFVTLALPIRKTPPECFLVVLIFRRYNATSFRATCKKCNDGGTFGEVLEAPLHHVSTIDTSRPAVPAAQLGELRDAAKSALDYVERPRRPAHQAARRRASALASLLLSCNPPPRMWPMSAS